MTLHFNRTSKIIIDILLGVLFLIALFRLFYWVVQMGQNILQEDFSAYYAAGQSLNYGLSPYLNNFANQPSIWDGIAHTRFSRFLYPPLAAVFFQPLASFPYETAKFLWEAINLSCLAVALYLTTRIFPLKSFWQVALVGIVVCLNYPLEVYLDRGQIDLLTLLIITAVILLMTHSSGKSDIFAGGLLVLATLLKVHCVYALPFLLVKKRWQVLKGYVYGGVVLVVASLLLAGGPRSLYDYVRNQFPRISGIAAVDDTKGKVLANTLDSITRNLPDGYTLVDGRLYRINHFSILNYATLVAPLYRFASNLPSNLPFSLSRSMISLVLLAVFFGLFWFWDRKFAVSLDSRQSEFLYWQIPFLVILLTGPITWLMNTVWVLPFVVILVSLLPEVMATRQKLAFMVICLGVILVLIFPSGFEFINHDELDKSMLGELIILAGLMFYLVQPVGNVGAAVRKEVKSRSGGTGRAADRRRPSLPAKSA